MMGATMLTRQAVSFPLWLLPPIAFAKSFDAFYPIGPTIVSGLDASDLAIETRVKGRVKQSSSWTSNMVFSPAFLVAYVSRMVTLLSGDLILTGTPVGVGPLAPGGRVEVEKVGVLANRVVTAAK